MKKQTLLLLTLLVLITNAMAQTTKQITSLLEILDIALKGIALAMGIAVVVLSFLDQIEIKNAVSMLGIGLVCLALSQFSNKNKDQG